MVDNNLRCLLNTKEKIYSTIYNNIFCSVFFYSRQKMLLKDIFYYKIQNNHLKRSIYNKKLHFSYKSYRIIKALYKILNISLIKVSKKKTFY